MSSGRPCAMKHESLGTNRIANKGEGNEGNGNGLVGLTNERCGTLRVRNEGLSDVWGLCLTIRAVFRTASLKGEN